LGCVVCHGSKLSDALTNCEKFFHFGETFFVRNLLTPVEPVFMRLRGLVHLEPVGCPQSQYPSAFDIVGQPAGRGPVT
jgi:hypothetical protein